LIISSEQGNLLGAFCTQGWGMPLEIETSKYCFRQFVHIDILTNTNKRSIISVTQNKTNCTEQEGYWQDTMILSLQQQKNGGAACHTCPERISIDSRNESFTYTSKRNIPKVICTTMWTRPGWPRSMTFASSM
jgi:hypothetical protein